MQLNTYITFDGRCEEALQFYAQCLGGKIAFLYRYEGSPMDKGDLSPEWKQKIMHATFEADGQTLMGSDGGPGYKFPGYAGFAVSLSYPKDPARGQQAFDALSAGGQVTMPFQKTFWAAGFGMFTDKFGVPWMINCES